jgi:transglutaminase-like putative cysteine protease
MYDDVQFGADEYYMYPATFLIKEHGDCEDHAFLYAALMKALGHKVILLSGQGHCAVGLDIDASGTYYRYISLIKYYYCEATATSAAGYTNYGYQDYGEIGDMSSNYNVYKFIPIPVM